jgi:hypothetical protein
LLAAILSEPQYIAPVLGQVPRKVAPPVGEYQRPNSVLTLSPNVSVRQSVIRKLAAAAPSHGPHPFFYSFACQSKTDGASTQILLWGPATSLPLRPCVQMTPSFPLPPVTLSSFAPSVKLSSFSSVDVSNEFIYYAHDGTDTTDDAFGIIANAAELGKTSG